MNINELIGRKFKRDKYGISSWTKTINHVYLSATTDFETNTMKLIVKIAQDEFIYGQETWFDLSECVILCDELEVEQNKQLLYLLENQLK
jgi:hypothetical protein